MVAYAFFMTLLVGFFIGVIFAVWLSVHLEDRQKEKARRRRMHPSTRPETPTPGPILIQN